MSLELYGQPRNVQFADLLRQHRIAAALSQEALAERAGISARAVSDLERGVKQRPHLETVRMLADALDLTGSDRTALAVASRPAQVSPTESELQAPVRAAVPVGLPVPSTPLVGRADIAKLAASLIRDDRARLLTLTGPGGVGKTRLAVAIATELGDAFPDGIAWIELAPVSDPLLIPGTILRSLGEVQSRDSSLREVLSQRQMLLVLDNCEHVREGAAQLVAELLPYCHDLFVLATSRSSLRLTAERLLPVEPLSLPEPEPSQTVESVSQSDAVRLFVLRARAMLPGFSLTPDNAEDVAAICRRLDGLPLAIELAAARVRVLSPAALLGQLDTRFRILTGGPADLPARHQSLQATLDWSYDLLNASLQASFRALAVFAGGFTLDAACAVIGEEDPLATLEDLEQLVDQNLVKLMPAAGDDLRFTMLETVGEYGREQCFVSGDEPEVRDRHVAWFMQLAERAEPELAGPHQGAWLRLLDADRDNLREALSWLHVNERRDDLLRLGTALWPYWARRGSDDEVRGWLDRALDPNNGDPATLAKSYHRVGNLAVDLGDYPRARDMFTSALGIAKSIPDQQGIANALNGLGVVASDTGDLDEARSLHGRSLAIRRGTGDQVGVARSLYNLGLIDAANGNNASARLHLSEALEIKESLGDAAGIAFSQWALAAIDIRDGNLARAHDLLYSSLNVFRELGDGYGQAFVLAELGALAHAQNDDRSSLTHLLEALEIQEDLRDDWGILATLEGLAMAASGLNQAATAAKLLGATEVIRRSIRVPRAPVKEVQISQLRLDCLAVLGFEDFEHEFARGGVMSLEQAIDAARTGFSLDLGT
jgi:predicted ATPase/DNA-binding XRE family transcriptional regulator